MDDLLYEDIKKSKFKIGFLKSESETEILKAIYALRKTKGVYGLEISIINDNPSKNRDDYVFPEDMYVNNYDQNSELSFEQFHFKYLQHRCGIHCMFSLNEEDTERVLVMLLPDFVRVAGMDHYWLQTYNRKTDKKMKKFMTDWKKEYEKTI